MIEVGLGIAACFAVAKVASVENESGIIWGAITFLLCAVSLLVPLPFLRIFIAGLLAFVLMIVYKMTRGR